MKVNLSDPGLHPKTVEVPPEELENPWPWIEQMLQGHNKTYTSAFIKDENGKVVGIFSRTVGIRKWEPNIMTRENFEKRAAKYTEEHLGFGDLWEEDDPYDLAEAADEAYNKGVYPELFIRMIFADDFARNEYDDQLFAESLEHEDE